MTAAEDVARGLRVLREGAGLTALERSLLAARGEDRTSFLQGMLSNDVASLTPGHGCHALLLTEQGRVVGDLRVLALADEILIDVADERRGAVRGGLERLVVADDVEIEERGWAALAVRGPRAAAVVGAAVGVDVGGLGECDHLAAPSGAGGERLVVRLRDVGSDGFVIWAPSGDGARDAATALRSAGAEDVAPAAVEAFRIAHGWAREGVDFDEKTLAPEVPSLARAISYRKGCYLGQEVVERVAARGHVNWLVMRLEGEGAEPPVAGAEVRRAGAAVGRVTSAASVGGRIAALARIRREAAEVGTVLEVDTGAGALAARVAATPAPE